MDDLPVRNLVAEDGKEYICLTPMPGNRCASIEQACIAIDEWAANPYWTSTTQPPLASASLAGAFFCMRPLQAEPITV